jgi:3D-(3,5/4)-trihydroxycyclohexane-1,2-dione acylhydrolase (decyclizing)
MTTRLTVAQAIVAFLKNQYSERDGQQQRLINGCFGIFGHGNVAGLGQALEQDSEVPYYLGRNEQAMVHTAVAFAKTSNRLRCLACTSSIGPGATNMLTGAAVATVNRLPVLLLPGDIFARRNVAPVLQQLESASTQDISVNDCFKPVARYWDRIERADQLLTSLPAAMRVLTSPAETGAVVLALPQDVQAEAFDFPSEFFEKRVWIVPRPRCDESLLAAAVQRIKASRKPLIIAGGGVIYSEATEELAEFARQTGIAVAETMAGKGSLRYDHPQSLGAIGVTGTPGANRVAREADLIIGIGTRYSDFTTASQTAFQNPSAKFINVNICEFDAGKQSGLALTSDAKVTLQELSMALSGFRVNDTYASEVEKFRLDWDKEVQRIYDLQVGPPISQGRSSV